jgi:GxxExxY protein
MADALTENEIAAIVVDAAIKVHKERGPGLLETVYEVILLHELKKRGLSCKRQEPIDVVYDLVTFEEAFRLDLLIEDKVIVEVKSIESNWKGPSEDPSHVSSPNEQTTWPAH